MTQLYLTYAHFLCVCVRVIGIGAQRESTQREWENSKKERAKHDVATIGKGLGKQKQGNQQEYMNVVYGTIVFLNAVTYYVKR